MVRSVVAWFLALACSSGTPLDLGPREVRPLVDPDIAAQQLAVIAAPAAKAVETKAPQLGPPPTFFVKPPPKAPRPRDPYEALKFDVEQERKALAWRQSHGEDVTADARNVLSRSVPDLIERWKGTRYSYSGTTTVPRKGAIACGYFVSTVLLHAGLDVERVDLSRQASEQIIRTLVPDPMIERFHKASRDTVVDRVKKLGEGVYIAGLDTHIGFLVNRKGRPVEFCHSTERNRKMGVVCEDARESPSFKSRYTVLGRLGEDALVQAWLADAKLPTARKLHPQAPVMNAPPLAPRGVEEALPDFEWFYEDWATLAMVDDE